MSSELQKPGHLRTLTRFFAAAAFLVIGLAALPTPGHAHDWDDYGRDRTWRGDGDRDHDWRREQEWRREREWREREARERYLRSYYGGGYYRQTYAPPPVYYRPPPVYYAPSSSFSIVVPFGDR